LRYNEKNIQNGIKIKNDRFKSDLKARVEFFKTSNLTTSSKNSLTNNSSDVYKIISIDGGGVRGVIPALILCEIERRCGRKLSKSVDFLAGTSTGAIIAASLSLPVSLENITQPKYSASDVLEFYVEKSSSIFSSETANLFGRFTTKYTGSKLADEFKRNFQDRCLNESLTELLIPTVNHYTNFSLRKFTKKDTRVSYVDALLATTAAPTFFPAHKISNEHGYFQDGGLRANNPAQLAYDFAINNLNKDKNKMFVLSLGTGICNPNPFDPDVNRSILYWAQNVTDKMIVGQEIDTEIHLNEVLGSNHLRLQVNLEEPIGLDDFKSIPRLIEIGEQYIEELNWSDERPLERIVNLFS
jgi:patatin-like phospholipase/acyl hydrolase